MVVPSVLIADYEHVRHVTRPERMLVPEAIPQATVRRLAHRIDPLQMPHRSGGDSPPPSLRVEQYYGLAQQRGQRAAHC
jgi:hypothetical protein